MFPELNSSGHFQKWLTQRTGPLSDKIYDWLAEGPPAPENVGNYRVYSHLGQSTEFLTVFLSRIPRPASLPRWIWLVNTAIIALVILFIVRGLLLNQWWEPRLTSRFLFLYFLASTLPGGLFIITSSAYQVQFLRSSLNQTTSSLETCLREFSTRKIQMEEEYRIIAGKLFKDKQLARLLENHGMTDDRVKEYILAAFKNRQNPLDLLGFFLLDLAGNGLEYCETPDRDHLLDVFTVFRASIIKKLRETFIAEDPHATLPEFKIPDQEQFGAEAFSSVTGNDLGDEIDKRRGSCISRKTGEGTSTQIHDFIQIDGSSRAVLYIVWDDTSLFNRSVKTTIDQFKKRLSGFCFYCVQ